MVPLDSAHYEIVFDVLQVGYRQWWLPAAGVPFLAIGAGLLLRGKRSERRSAVAQVLGSLVGIFAIVWIGGALASTYGDYARLRDALRDGEYTTVEGVVTSFVPGDAGDHRQESFSVAGHHFSYSPSILTAGFNRSVPHGGPITEGLRVRIAAVNGQIARLEVAR